MKLAQQSVENVFGKISPPPGAVGLNTANPLIGLSNLFTTLIRVTFIVAAITVLVYLLWGALDWITSGGEKEKVEKARDKMTHAIVGILILVASLTIFSVITGNILGIIDTSGGGFQFKLPTLGTPPPTPLPTTPALPPPNATPEPI